MYFLSSQLLKKLRHKSVTVAQGHTLRREGSQSLHLVLSRGVCTGLGCRGASCCQRVLIKFRAQVLFRLRVVAEPRSFHFRPMKCSGGSGAGSAPAPPAPTSEPAAQEPVLPKTMGLGSHFLSLEVIAILFSHL